MVGHLSSSFLGSLAKDQYPFTTMLKAYRSIAVVRETMQHPRRCCVSWRSRYAISFWLSFAIRRTAEINETTAFWQQEWWNEWQSSTLSTLTQRGIETAAVRHNKGVFTVHKLNWTVVRELQRERPRRNTRVENWPNIDRPSFAAANQSKHGRDRTRVTNERVVNRGSSCSG